MALCVGTTQEGFLSPAMMHVHTQHVRMYVLKLVVSVTSWLQSASNYSIVCCITLLQEGIED